MIVSLPPDMINPSGKGGLGGRYATVLTNDWEWEEIVASKIGGLSDSIFHNRTVPSRDAEMTAFGSGKKTART